MAQRDRTASRGGKKAEPKANFGSRTLKVLFGTFDNEGELINTVLSETKGLFSVLFHWIHVLTYLKVSKTRITPEEERVNSQ